jgi:Family of unknown function (DUF6298)/Bacterial Ig-like domain (group 2)
MSRLLCWGCAVGISLLAVCGCQVHGQQRAPARVVSLAILPGSQSIRVGDRLRLALVARYDDGAVRDLRRSATWASSAPRLVRLVEDGRVNALASGRATISATVGGRRVSTTVRVGVRSLGPLRVGQANPRYFVDRAGRVLYLAGAHTWGNLVDNGTTSQPPRFNYSRFLDALQTHELWIFRLWAWEQASKSGELKGGYFFSPLVYRRTGPGNASDGRPRFDLTQFDPVYFSRLRQRVVAARERGIYVVVMLFNGWSVERKGDGDNPWEGHPFNRANNVNGIDGDRDGDGSGDETHTLAESRVTRLQEAYVSRVIRAVGDQPNVLYEVSNESSSGSLAWQNHIVRYVRANENPRDRHPIGITAEYPGGNNADLLSSSADWVSPNGSIDDVDPGSGVKPVLADTDHYCGVCGTSAFPWQAFTRGLNPLLMDPYDGRAIGLGARDADHNDPRWEVIRRRLGVSQIVSRSIDMKRLTPRGDLSSTGYCLADAKVGRLYVVYLPSGGTATVNVSASRSSLRVEWIDPDTGVVTRGSTIRGGARRSVDSLGDGDAVLVLRAIG